LTLSPFILILGCGKTLQKSAALIRRKKFRYRISIEEKQMKTRRNFITYLFFSLAALVTSLFAVSCGKKPDAETEPSPQWPPKE
jgi:hypothetical protein